MKNFYEVLGFVEGQLPSPEDIKAAYRNQRSVWHPDRNNSPEAPERMQQIQVAYDVLSDVEKRAHYDATGSVDDAAGIRKRAMHEALTVLLMQVVNSPIGATRNVLEEMQAHINRECATTANTITTERQAARRMEKIASRLHRRRRDGENMLGAALLAQAERHHKAIKSNEEALEVLKDMRLALDHYEYEMPEEQGYGISSAQDAQQAMNNQIMGLLGVLSCTPY